RLCESPATPRGEAMRKLLRRWRMLLVAVLSVLFLSNWITHPVAQQKPAPAEAGESKGKAEYWGVAACSFCLKGLQETPGAIICKCSEVTTWETRDKHAEAWKVLVSSRAQEMGKRLGYKEVDITIYKKITKGKKVEVVKDETKRVNEVAVKAECVA